jgi:formylglycine-generating enzyme required for sulfatase activity
MSTDSENTPDFSELSLAQVSDLVAARPELLALAKREKGVKGRILDISIQAQYDRRIVEIGYMELAKYRKRAKEEWYQRELEQYRSVAVENMPLFVEFDDTDYYMVLGDSATDKDQEWNPLEVEVKIDGETVFKECVSPGNPHGVVFRKGKSPIRLNFGGGKKEWLIGVSYWRVTLLVTCVKEVAADFRFDPAKLTIPYFGMPIGYFGPSALVNHYAIRYKGLAPEDFSSDEDIDYENCRNYLLLSRDGLVPFPERMNGCDWSNLLSHSPQYADLCDWATLNEYGGSDWVYLLKAQPQLADKCDWSALDSDSLLDLFKAQPQLADKCDWSKVNGMALDGLLAARPEFADRCGRGKATHAGRRAPRPKVLSRVKDDSMNSLVALIEADMVPIPGQDYALGKFEVVQALWEAVMGSNPSKFKGKARPVESITWDECQKFLDRLNALPDVKASGRPFRLPANEEWDFASRAGSIGDFGFPPGMLTQDPAEDIFCRLANGTEIHGTSLGEIAWYRDNSGGRTQPVGQKKPNAFGLYDMEGNVEEWVSSEGNRRLLTRGFSWSGSGIRGMVCRLGYDPCAGKNDRGFRLARDLFSSEDERLSRVAARIAADMVPIPPQESGVAFSISKYEVTQSVWKAIMGTNPSFKYGMGLDIPVNNVSWHDCQQFLERLNAIPDVKALGRPFRLPTAKEWVHACLAGAKKDGYCRLADGTDINRKMLNRVAWIDDAQSGGWRPRPVGLKESNAFGLFDMIGSVLEWTATPADGGRYYVCGPTTGAGSYKATWEGSAVPDTRDKVIGFRLAR